MYNCKCKLPNGENQTNSVMQFLEISKGQSSDVKKTLEMFVSITDQLLNQGIDQWNYDYPDFAILNDDVLNGDNFLIKKDDDVAASIVLNNIQDAQYKKIHWRTRNSDILVIHRLGVHPKYQGQGLGKKMCLFAESFGRKYGYKSIRLDAYAGNDISNKLYQSLGYSQANGYCYFRKKAIPFYCFEKKIEL
jgi:ribosomal protein S18 acetylase RimI-like enzyme